MRKIVSVKQSELEAIAKRSLRNCHAFGLDSVMFDDTPGRRVRAFVARKNHEMWMNLNHPLSIAWHPHHCNITLQHIFGRTFNVTPTYVKRGGEVFSAYEYQSQILAGVGGFRRLKGSIRCIPVPEKLVGSIFMHASEIHTVFVPKGEESAWYVLEHSEDEFYKPWAWSNVDLTSFDFSRLYKPMTIARLRDNLRKLRIAIQEGQ